MTHLLTLQRLLRSAAFAGVIIPSTDEFLSEFTPAPKRRLRWVTGFRGSAGTAIVLQDRAALFLDGRYLLQAAADTEGSGIDIESASVDARRNWLASCLAGHERLAFDPWLHSIGEMAQWRRLACDLGIELVPVTSNLVDELWTDSRPVEQNELIVDYALSYAGESFHDKCARIGEHLRVSNMNALLIAHPEDVSWLLNVRAEEAALRTELGDWHVVPSCASRALVSQDNRVVWFVDRARLASDVQARVGEVAEIVPPQAIAAVLRSASRQGPIGVDPHRTPVALAAMIEEVGECREDDVVARWRWRKHRSEIESARQVHIWDAAAVVRFMAWITRAVLEGPINEYEAAAALERFRGENAEYKGRSMPLMAASGSNGAQPHYVPRSEGSRNLNDHPIFWMDSGGQYPGGTTDNTVTLALGVPESKHVSAHTLVLKGFIALATARVPVGITGLGLDTIARQPLWSEGKNYAHGTGHGVGNYLNIHEGPYISYVPHPMTTAQVDIGMIITNEPGFYVESDFGLRIESHMVSIPSRYPHFMEFETISRLPIDPRLVDFSQLSMSERRWLAEYHRSVLKDLQSLLEPPALDWLRGVVNEFIRASDECAAS